MKKTLASLATVALSSCLLFAGTFEAPTPGGRPGGISAVPAVSGPDATIPSLSVSGNDAPPMALPDLGAQPAATPALTPALTPNADAQRPVAAAIPGEVQVPAVAHALAVDAPAIHHGDARNETPASDRADASREAGTRGDLAQTVQDIHEHPENAQTTLNGLFWGAPNSRSEHAVSRFHDLPGMGLADLEGHAKWWEAPFSERVMAIRLIAERGGDEAKEALRRIAASNPDGGLEDYEVHRIALRELANRFGELHSLRPVSAALEETLLAELRSGRRRNGIADYDDTTSEYSKPPSPEMADALRRAGDAGIRAAILTDRPARPMRPGEVGILDNVEGALAPGLLVISDKSLRGSRLTQGKPEELWNLNIAWTPEERTALAQVDGILQARYPTQEFPPGTGKHSDTKPYSYVLFLKVGMSEKDLLAAAHLFRQELDARGLHQYDVVAKFPKDPANPPYIAVGKVTKAVGVRQIMAHWGVDGSQVVILGDQFITQKFHGQYLLEGTGRGTDEFMVDGAPGALTIAVGRDADPRLDGVFLWRTPGPAGSIQVWNALAAAPARP